MRIKNSELLGRADLLDESLDRPFEHTMACVSRRCGISEVPPRLGLRKEGTARFKAS